MPVKYAIDCEMVGSGRKSMLARVTIVDEYERVVLDTYVKPTAEVTDYRQSVSGINERDLRTGVGIKEVRRTVKNLIYECILIGHSLHFDLEALGLSHPESYQRDLAKYEPFTKSNNGLPVGLKNLTKKYLGRNIQMGPHSSIEDAKASMAIYKIIEHEWEEAIEKEKKENQASLLQKAVVITAGVVSFFIFLASR